MPETRSSRLRRADQLPCAAQIVHRFADGWTIRTPQTIGDVHREGVLMSNCLELDPLDVADLQRCLGKNWHTDELDGDAWDAYRSLRDPDNLPHLTFRCDEDHGFIQTQEIMGRHNSAPKLSHYLRVCAWAAQSGKDAVVYLPDHARPGEQTTFPLTPQSLDRVVAYHRRAVHMTTPRFERVGALA